MYVQVVNEESAVWNWHLMRVRMSYPLLLDLKPLESEQNFHVFCLCAIYLFAAIKQQMAEDIKIDQQCSF